MTHTDLSAEEPSERAATGPQEFALSLEAKVKALGGTSMQVRAPSGGVLESAVAVFFLLFAGVVLAVLAVVALSATGMPGWLIAVTAVAILGAAAATATILCAKKGRPKG